MKRLVTILIIIMPFHLLGQDLKITYIANEGVLIANQNKKVLIDALFDDFYKQYLSPSAEALSKMMASENPFDGVDVVLTTHFHRDHFEANITGNFLKEHQESALLSSNQIKDELQSKYVDYSSIEKRVKAHARGVSTLKEEINGVTVYSFFMYHAGGERTKSIENMGFIVEVGDKKILHLGDSDMNPERFREVDLAKYEIDIALVPYWYMTSDAGIDIINNSIKPKQLIGVHYPKAPSKTALDEIMKNYPKARVFKEAMESFSMK
ncbi:MBL fold metallo-hydrolase [Roseivirga sp.]|uniref:MBL fold metallo-hydrolase n=1 Tax=Roseivirga sp. TaxID=1964215 RepID=UPI003B8BD966